MMAVVDLAAQREHLQDLEERTRAELAQLAESRRGLLLDGSDTEIRAVETEMAKRTADLDRLKDSLVELDKRQARAEAKAVAERRREHERQLEGRLQRLGALGTQLADHLQETGRLLGEVDQIEHEILEIGARCDQQLPIGTGRRTLLAKAMLVLKISLPTYFASQDDIAAAEAALRATPHLVATPGHATSTEPQRGPVPFVEDLLEDAASEPAAEVAPAGYRSAAGAVRHTAGAPDQRAEAMIRAQKERAALIQANQ